MCNNRWHFAARAKCWHPAAAPPIGTGALWQRAAPPDRSQRKQFRRSAHRGSYRRRIYVWPLQGSFEWFSLKGRTQNVRRIAAGMNHGAAMRHGKARLCRAECPPHFLFVLSKEKSPPQRWKRKPLRNELAPHGPTHPKRGAGRHKLPTKSRSLLPAAPIGTPRRTASPHLVAWHSSGLQNRT